MALPPSRSARKLRDALLERGGIVRKDVSSKMAHNFKDIHLCHVSMGLYFFIYGKKANSFRCSSDMQKKHRKPNPSQPMQHKNLVDKTSRQDFQHRMKIDRLHSFPVVRRPSGQWHLHPLPRAVIRVGLWVRLPLLGHVASPPSPIAGVSAIELCDTAAIFVCDAM